MLPNSEQPNQCHIEIRCDGCFVMDIEGFRYACLICSDYDLCGECFRSKRVSQEHRSYHPVQAMLPPDEFLRSVEFVTENDIRIYRCPHCGEPDFNVRGLTKHCQLYHEQEAKHHVRCPVCVTYRVPGGQSLYISEDTLIQHLLNTHRSEEPVPATTEQECCAVCLNDVTLSANTRTLGCGHRFHRICARQWLRTSSSCPICRADVAECFTF